MPRSNVTTPLIFANSRFPVTYVSFRFRFPSLAALVPTTPVSVSKCTKILLYTSTFSKINNVARSRSSLQDKRTWADVSTWEIREYASENRRFSGTHSHKRARASSDVNAFFVCGGVFPPPLIAGVARAEILSAKPTRADVTRRSLGDGGARDRPTSALTVFRRHRRHRSFAVAAPARRCRFVSRMHNDCMRAYKYIYTNTHTHVSVCMYTSMFARCMPSMYPRTLLYCRVAENQFVDRKGPYRNDYCVTTRRVCPRPFLLAALLP